MKVRPPSLFLPGGDGGTPQFLIEKEQLTFVYTMV